MYPGSSSIYIPEQHFFFITKLLEENLIYKQTQKRINALIK